MNAQINRLARKNSGYYLHERKVDDNKDSWFRYIKNFWGYSEPILISPAMARDLLGSKKRGARSKNGMIALNYSGELVDGFEKVESIASGKKPAVALVCFNVPNKDTRLYTC